MSTMATTTTTTTTEKKPNAFAKAAEPFACGGAAATFASIVIHPMDLAKVRSKEHYVG